MGTTKKLILFPTPDRPLENVATGNIFWVIWRRLFKKILVVGNPDWKFLNLFQNLHSELVYTVLCDQNPLLDLGWN